MTAVRSSTFAESVLWHVDTHLPPTPLRDLPHEADLVIIGAGYAGLAAAREAARRGLHTVILEAGQLGTGASTRNGGMVIPELKSGPETLESTYGELGRRMYSEVNQAFDHVEQLVHEEEIDCDYHCDGQLYLAHNSKILDKLRSTAAEHQRTGDDVVFLEGSKVTDEIGSDQFPAALRFARTGGLQPAKFHAGLIRLAIDAGAELHPETRALKLDRDATKITTSVTTSRGNIRAQHVFVATNATADSLVPGLQRRVLPLGSFIIATEPLDESTRRSITKHDRMLIDSRNFLHYWRLTPDGRLAFGGRKSLRTTTVTQATDHLYDSLMRIHPQLESVQIDFAWGGDVAMTLDRLPHVGAINGAWYATGCNGSGVALMPWLGGQMGAHIAGDGPLPSFAELKHRSIPLSRWRALWTPLVGRWFAGQDRLDERSEFRP